MDYSMILIYAGGAMVVLVLLLYLLVAQTILGAALKKPSAHLIQRSDCPAYLQEFYALKETELQDLGFHFSCCLLVDDLFVKKHTKRYYYVYYNPDKKTYAHLIASPEADGYIPFWVSFHTYFKNGKKLVTVNGIRHTIMDTMPGDILQDGYVESLEKQLALHLEYLSCHEELEIKEFGETRQDFEEIVELEQESLTGYLAQLERKKRIFKTGEDRYLFRTFASLLFAHRMITGLSKFNAMRRKVMDSTTPVDLPVELEVENYANAQSLANPEKRNSAGKIVFLLASVVMFVAAFGVLISFEIALLLIGVIFIHEGGHLLAMWLFGYKDLRMLFIPLFGAVAIGSGKNIKPYKKVITLFAGPVPGIILAFLLLVLIRYGNIPVTHFSALMLVVSILFIVNYFNLIPLIPLDGGQIFDTIIFSRFAILQFLFFLISIIALVLFAIFLKEPLLLIIALIIPLGYRNHFFRRKLTARVRETLNHHTAAEVSDTDVLTEAFRAFNASSYRYFPFQKKVQIVKYVEDNVNAAKAPAGTVIFTLLVYALIVVLPLVYFLIPLISTGTPFYYEDPCTIVRKAELPKNVIVEASRFERVDRSLVKDAVFVCFRHCFYLPLRPNDKHDDDFQLYSPAPTGDFLSRLWALYGEPDLMENSFVYTLRDKKTGFLFTAYCATLMPAYGGFGGNEREKSELIPSLYLFEELLKKTKPVDCHIEIDIDFSKFRDNTGDEEEFQDFPGEYKARYKIGSKDGVPYIQLQQVDNLKIKEE
jgi:Zn-dependent protease